MLRLVVTDLDGTLLNSSSEAPVEIFDIIRALQARGVRFAVASGRQVNDLRKIFKGLEGIYYITQNGSYIEIDGAEVSNTVISGESASAIARTAYECHLFPMFYTKDALMIQDDDPGFIKKLNDYKVHFTYTRKVDLESGIGKISLMALDNNAGCFKSRFSSIADIATCVSSKDILDFNSSTCNKGTAVTLLQEKLGISPDETIVFGDAENDVSMFATSTHSYAMMNAPESVKQHARYLAPSNDDLGVVRVLREIQNPDGIRTREQWNNN